MRARAIAVVLGVGAGLAACGAPPAPAPLGRCDQADAGAGCVELGVGDDAAVVEGAVPLVHGPQGGWHVVVGLRFRDTAVADGLAVEYTVRDADDDRVLGTARYAIEPRRLVVSGEYSLRQGDIVILDVASGDEVLDTEVVITVGLAQGTGEASAIDERVLTVVPAT